MGVSSQHHDPTALFYNLNFTKVYINLEQYVFHQLNFMLNQIILIYSGTREARSSLNILRGRML
jgi:hypothetical protein